MTLEEARVQLRRKLEETYGVDGATILLDQPPGGWSNLVTNETLHLELAVVRSEMATLRTELKGEVALVRSDMAALRHELLAAIHQEAKTQTWRLITAIIALVGVLGGLFLTVGQG